MIDRKFALPSLAIACLLLATPARSVPAQQMPNSAAAPTRVIGTLVSSSATALTVKPDSGEPISVALSPDTPVLSLPPGSTDLKSAHAASLEDLAPNDRVLVFLNPATGAPTARRILVMKSTAIAAQNQAAEQGWAHSRGGVVESIDPANNSFTLKSSGRILTVTTTPSTIVRRYAAGSVRFDDAQRSSLAKLHTGDEVRVRGTALSPTALTADEFVFGSFRQLAGQVLSIDLATSRLVLRDSKSKTPITVMLSPRTELRNLPPEFAKRLAEQSTAAGHGDHHQPAASPAAAERPTDPAEAIAHLPTLSPSALKPGEAVILVATTGPDHVYTATTVLTGVAPLLSAIEGGGAETSLSAWSLGGSPGAPE